MPDRHILNTTRPAAEPQWRSHEFRTRPYEAGKTLRALHSSRDFKKCDSFVLSLINYYDGKHPPDAVRREWLRGELFEALFDIVMDDGLYPGFLVDEPTTMYLLHAYGAVLRLMPDSMAPGFRVEPASQDAVIHRFLRLWSMLLRFPRIFRYHGPDNQSSARMFLDILGVLMHGFVDLFKQERHRVPHVDDSSLVYVAFLGWAGSEDFRSAHRFISIVQILFHTVPLDKRLGFVKSGVETGGVIPELIVARSVDALMNDSTLLDYELYKVLSMLEWMCLDPKIQDARDKRLLLPQAMLRVAQHQVCSGDDFWLPGVADVAFMQTHAVITKLGVEDVSIVLNHRDICCFLMVISRALRPILTHEHANGYECLVPMAELCAAAMSRYGGVVGSSLDPELKASVARSWYRGREALRDPSPSSYTHRGTVLQAWMDLGKACGLDLDTPFESVASVASAALPSAPRKTCAWRECVCYGDKPEHKLRECKQCSRVMYCSSKCQKQDWQDGGHKHVCRAAQASGSLYISS